MVRRWSSINTINTSLLSFAKFAKIFKVSVFRSVVNYKRYAVKYTKFKRRTLARWKHRTNWIIYLNVIKFWVDDYRLLRQLSRYQFFNKIFTNNFYIYDFNYIKVRYAKTFSTFSNMVTISLTKNLHSYFLNKNFYPNDRYLKNSNLICAFLPENSELGNNINIVPFFSSYDQFLYTPNSKAVYDVTSLFTSLFSISLQHALEVYKILVVLNYYLLKR